eukprot:gene16991-31989_t
MADTEVDISRDGIAKLLRTIERYNPGNLAVLSQYLSKTCEDKSYDIEAYLAILKLYQFNPTKFDLETTRTILLKALTSLPSNDFTLCLYLLSEEQHQEPRIKILIELFHEIEKCRFDDVWEFLVQDPDVLKAKVLAEEGADGAEATYNDVEVAGFLDSIRNFVGHVIDMTYQEADVELVSAMLGGLKGSELVSFAGAHGWTMGEGGKKIFIAKQEEMVQSKNIIETLAFGSLAPLMAHANIASR